MWKFPWRQLLDRSCIFLLVPTKQVLPPTRGVHLRGLVKMATQIKNEQSNPFIRKFILLHPPGSQWRHPFIQVHRWWNLDTRSLCSHSSQWVWFTEQHSRGIKILIADSSEEELHKERIGAIGETDIQLLLFLRSENNRILG